MIFKRLKLVFVFKIKYIGLVLFIRVQSCNKITIEKMDFAKDLMIYLFMRFSPAEINLFGFLLSKEIGGGQAHNYNKDSISGRGVRTDHSSAMKTCALLLAKTDIYLQN